MRGQAAFVSLLVLLSGSIALAEPITLTGTVLGPDGKPVAGAQVLTLRIPTKGYDVKLIEATTDVAGAFSLQTDLSETGGRSSLPVLARKVGFALAVGEGKAGTPLTLTLGDKPEQRSGILLAPDGKPLAGASVVVSFVGDLRAMGPTGPRRFFSFGRGDWKATTDDQGRFAFEGIPPGFTVRVGVTIDGYSNASAQAQDDKPVTLSLRPEAIITGRVLLSGKPAPEVMVQGWVGGPNGASASALSAADGTYTLRHLVAGEARISVRAGEGYATPPRRTATLVAGQTTTGIDFNLTPGGLIKGKVTSVTDGKPVAGAYVIASPAADGAFANVQTGPDGTYQLRLAPGKYRLASRWPGPEPAPPAPGPEVLTVEEGGVIEGKDLTVKPPHTVHGQVLLPDGKLATGVVLQGFGENLWDRGIGIEGGKFEIVMPEPVTPAPAGAGAPPPPPTMPPLLIARDIGKNLCAVFRADKLPDQVTLTLRPAATAILPVVDPQGQPLPNIPVISILADDQFGGFAIAGAKTDKAGLARLTALPPGLQLRFQVSWDMRHLVATEAPYDQSAHVLQAGEELKLPPIVMDPKGRSLNVFVGDAEGKPLRGAQVYAEHVQQPFVTDEQGKVTLTGLALRGVVVLLAAHPTAELYAAQLVDPDKDPWPGLLLKAPGQATGVLIDGDGGKPLAGVSVMPQPGRGNWWAMMQQLPGRLGLNGPGAGRAETDADGRWTVDKLVPGVEYRLVVFAKSAGPGGGGPAGFAGVFTAEGGPQVQDVGVMEVRMADAPGGPGGMPPPPPPPAQ